MKKQFDNLGFVIIRNFISKNKAKKLSKEFRDFCDKNPNETQPDNQVKRAPAYYNHSAFVELLSSKTAKVSKLIGERVLPSYCYARVYTEKCVLEKHTDRPAWEISVTACVKKYDDWPIVVEGTSFELEEGDAILYAGCDQEHWRPGVYKGEGMAQVFLHYVNKNGINKNHAYDQLNK